MASPKLFQLLNDQTSPVEFVQLDGRQIQTRKIKLNNKEVKLVKLCQIADVKVGLQTGDNDSYLFQKPEARGTYRNIEKYKEYLLTDKDITKISGNNKLRLEIIDKGISTDDPKSARYFGGRYILPYDKGGESDSEEGWLPNYYVPTDYFIDWSEWAVKRMRTLTTKARNKLEGKQGGNDKLCSRFQNSDTYFTKGLTFSRTGVYAPTFRLNSGTVYDTEGSTIFLEGDLSNYVCIGLFASKLSRFLLKTIGHTVHCQVDELKELPILIKNSDRIIDKVKSIVANQKINQLYDYASNEQIEIDRLVYEAYGLNEEDITEVENWYARRYPKLARAQNRKKITGTEK